MHCMRFLIYNHRSEDCHVLCQRLKVHNRTMRGMYWCCPGLVVGPPSYVVAASGLHPIHPENSLIKNYDDTYLLVGSSNIDTLAMEFDHVKKWAATNNLRLNPSKTRELIIYRKRPCFDPLGDPLLSGATRVGSLRVLGVVICSNLTMGTHLDELLSNCASSIHALCMLRTHGLQPPQLQEAARMTTVASLLYASPAWWGFTSAQDRDRLERIVWRLRRCGYLPESAPSFAEMASKADKSLFRSITSSPGHVLSRFLPRVKSTGYNLRPRAHVYELPKKDNRNFMSRVL